MSRPSRAPGRRDGGWGGGTPGKQHPHQRSPARGPRRGPPNPGMEQGMPLPEAKLGSETALTGRQNRGESPKGGLFEVRQRSSDWPRETGMIRTQAKLGKARTNFQQLLDRISVDRNLDHPRPVSFVCLRQEGMNH